MEHETSRTETPWTETPWEGSRVAGWQPSASSFQLGTL